MNVVGYPTPGKGKALRLVSAICESVGGRVVEAPLPEKLLPGAAVFYGVTPATVHLWRQAKAEGRDWYYIDNAYFDSCREKYFRVTRNRLQHDGRGKSDGKRFAALGLTVQPWREPGKHILVVPQSDEFMRLAACYPGSWLEDVCHDLRADTKREVRVRPWSRDKKAWYASLPEDLKNCHLLVTYSSAAAISALLVGIPAIVNAHDSIAWPMGTQDGDLENPTRPDGREAWAAVVADNQWTLEEMRCGLAWEMMHREVALA